MFRSSSGRPGGNAESMAIFRSPCRREVPKEQSIFMRSTFKSAVFVSLFLTAFLLAACSGPVGSGGGGNGGWGGGTGPFTIVGAVRRVAGAGVFVWAKKRSGGCRG